MNPHPLVRPLCGGILLAALAGCGGSAAPAPATISPGGALPTIPPQVLATLPTTPGAAATPAAGLAPRPTPAQDIIVAVSPLSGQVTDRGTFVTASVQGRQAILSSRTIPPGLYEEFLHVMVQNRSRGAIGYGAANFTLVDERGVRYNASVTLPHGTNIPAAGLLEQGHSVAGWVGFLVPRTARTFTLFWDDNSALAPPGGLVTYPIHP